MVQKAELHVHLEGTIHPSVALQLAARHREQIDNLIDGEIYRWTDFTTFLKAYDTVAALVKTPEDYIDVTYDYAMRCAEAGVIYLEISASADHAKRIGCSYPTFIEALDEGLKLAEEKSGIISRLVVVGVRHLGPEKVYQSAQNLHRSPHPRVTGFGMAGDERMHHKKDFIKAFECAKEAEVGLTVHAGEFDGANSVEDALDHLSVSRIGHGVRAIESPATVERLVREKTVLEVSPGSNVALGLYPTYNDHPIKKLKDAGVKVTINSDDPPFFATSIGHEYTMAADMGFSDEEITDMTRTAIEAAFVDEPTRKHLLTLV